MHEDHNLSAESPLPEPDPVAGVFPLSELDDISVREMESNAFSSADSLEMTVLVTPPGKKQKLTMTPEGFSLQKRKGLFSRPEIRQFRWCDVRNLENAISKNGMLILEVNDEILKIIFGKNEEQRRRVGEILDSLSPEIYATYCLKCGAMMEQGACPACFGTPEKNRINGLWMLMGGGALAAAGIAVNVLFGAYGEGMEFYWYGVIGLGAIVFFMGLYQLSTGKKVNKKL